MNDDKFNKTFGSRESKRSSYHLLNIFEQAEIYRTVRLSL